MSQRKYYEHTCNNCQQSFTCSRTATEKRAPKYCSPRCARLDSGGGVQSRFWRDTDKRGDNECWVWMGTRMHFGHGQLWRDKKPMMAHRYAYELAYGPIPDGMCVCHKCDNPPCVNPAHLFLGTRSDNTKDRDLKGRTARGKQNGLSYPKHGSINPKAKLNETQVLEIRARFAAGGITQTALAKEYGVGKNNVQNIIVRRSWTHI